VALVLRAFTGTGPASVQQARDTGEHDVAARAWVLTDLRSGGFLAGEDASRKLPIASTTKIMEALVVLENGDFGGEVMVSRDAASYATHAYSNVGLLPGDTLRVRELLMAALISSAFLGDESYVCVILDSREERFGASIRTLRHGFIAYDRKDQYATMEAPYQRDEVVDLVAGGDVASLVDASPDVEREVEFVDHPPLSARAGTTLGQVVVRVDGEKIGETALVAKRGYEKPSLGQRLWYTVGGIFK
jgi:D-alanyl-D-alanine carboxypeptidase